MKKAKLFGAGALALVAALTLAACGNNSKTDGSDAASGSDAAGSVEKPAAIITDTGGVDDRSFNQSAWEGLQAWGKTHDLSKDHGFSYFQSSNESDYAPNIDTAIAAGYQTIFGVGYKLTAAIVDASAQNPDANFVIIDDVPVDADGNEKIADNVSAATFMDNENSYLVGLAAAYTTETNVVGFIGGVEGTVIDRFQAGFEAGVADGAKALGKDVEVKIQYAGDFNAPDKGKTIAQGMYAANADIIFHASGATGNGLLQEAKSINESGDKKVWVIGVDRDQSDEGSYKDPESGKDANFVLTSTVKGVGTVVEDLAEKANTGEFPGGQHIAYDLKSEAISITDGQLSDDVLKAVNEAKDKIVAGDIKVPEAPEK